MSHGASINKVRFNNEGKPTHQRTADQRLPFHHLKFSTSSTAQGVEPEAPLLSRDTGSPMLPSSNIPPSNPSTAPRTPPTIRTADTKFHHQSPSSFQSTLPRLRQLSEASDRAVLCDWIDVAPPSWRSALNWEDSGYCPANATLNGNSYTGVETDSISLEVTELALFERGLSGSLPEGWSALRALSRLSLGSNGLRGSLPEVWSALSRLSHLYLNHNVLSGSLPGAWSALSSLIGLSLRDNNLSGSLPEAWGALSSLTGLYCQNNILNGSLPEAWSGLSRLEEVMLNNNHLNGSLPEGWSGINSLRTLYLNHNALSGRFLSVHVGYSWSC